MSDAVAAVTPVSPPRLYRGPTRHPDRRARLRRSGLPRLPGVDHDGSEGRAYRTYLLGRGGEDRGLLARLGLTIPLPTWALDYVRECGRLETDLCRAHAATVTEEASPTRREAEVRRLLRMEQRLRGQKLTQERMLAAICREEARALARRPPTVAEMLRSARG